MVQRGAGWVSFGAAVGSVTTWIVHELAAVEAAGVVTDGGITEVGANAIVEEACAAELGGGDSMDGGLMDEGGAMSAVYSGCTGVRSGRGNGESGGVGGASMTRREHVV